MKEQSGRHLAEEIISHFPDAALAYEIARELAPHLPLRNLEALTERELRIRGERFPTEALEGQLPKDIFPIESERDLARKVSAAVKVGTAQIARGVTFRTESVRKFAERVLAAEAGAQIPSGYFGGSSVFGEKRK